MECSLSFIKEIDFYGKHPEFYLEGKTKKVTVIGRIFTVLYIFLYMAYFVYKLYRTFTRADLAFFDSDSEGSSTLSMDINKENFNFMFTFLDGSTGEAFQDETIYYPIAYFNDEVIEMRPCSIDNIGSQYIDLFDDPQLDKYYCIENLNRNLIAYRDYFYIQIMACRNSSENNNHCQPKEVIDSYLNGNDMIIKLEDILLNPKDYNFPIKQIVTDIYSYIFKNIGQYIYIEMQLVNIETNDNLIGFDFFSEEKLDFYIRFDGVSTVPTPGYNLDDEEYEFPICEFEIQLKDKFFSEKRQYTQLIDVLGEVGGFMEFMSSFFGLICSFIVDIIYENTLINELFSFDLNKKIIYLKNCRKVNEYNSCTLNKIENIQKLDEKNSQLSKLKLNLNFRNSENKKKIVLHKLNKSNNSKAKLSPNQKIISEEDLKSNENCEKNKNQRNKENNNENPILIFNLRERNSCNLIKNNNENHIINSIELNQFFVHFCFCFVRKKINFQNILLNEGMNIITEKLDVINIFRIMYFNEEIKDNNESNNFIIQMSDECLNSLRNINII